MVLGVVGQRLHRGRQFHDVVEGGRHALTEQLLGHAQDVRCLTANLVGDGTGAVHQFGGGHNVGDEAPFFGGGGADGVAGVEKLAGARHADHARQEPRTAVAGYEADLEEGRAEDRRVGGDARVTQASHIIAEADGGAVDRRDDRHFDAPDRADNTMDAVAVMLADVDACAAETVGALFHGFDIAACREGLARACQDDATDITVGIDAGCGLGEILRIVRRAERVADFGAVDGQGYHVAVFFKQQGIGHSSDAPLIGQILRMHKHDLASYLNVDFGNFNFINHVSETNVNNFRRP